MTIQDLKSQKLILFEVISGSKSFGLDTPSSDTDIKGVYYLPKEQFFGLDYIPQISNETNDEVYYELGRFVELLQKNNPNILEILATPDDCVLYKNPIMNQLKIEYFLSKLCKDSFAGYAVTQIKKARGLKKKILNPMEKERKTIFDFCYILKGYDTVLVKDWLLENDFIQENCGLTNLPHSKGMYALFYDANKNFKYKGILQKENSNEISLSSIQKGETEIAYLYFNQDNYSSYCKDYREYWDWIEKRNDERYKNTVNTLHATSQPQNYDSKNMMHTIRLLQSAEQILANGKLNIRVNNREELLEIKSGNREYNDLLLLADNLIVSIEKNYETCTLQDFPNKQKTENILVQMRTQLYQ